MENARNVRILHTLCDRKQALKEAAEKAKQEAEQTKFEREINQLDIEYSRKEDTVEKEIAKNMDRCLPLGYDR